MIISAGNVDLSRKSDLPGYAPEVIAKHGLLDESVNIIRKPFIKGESGNIIEVVLMFEDVTKQHLARSVLKENEEQLRIIRPGVRTMKTLLRYSFISAIDWGPSRTIIPIVFQMASSPGPEHLKKGNNIPEEDTKERGSAPWVSWIAIFLGVGMIFVGALVLLWGLAWQTGVGEADKIEGSSGGPGLIPFGILCVAFGFMWVLTGWNRFKKRHREEGLRSCPNCGRRIEMDLNFCYYCNTTFDRERDKKVAPVSKREEKRARPLNDGKR